MSEDDFWSKWLKRRTSWPLSGKWISEDLDTCMEMENLLERNFSDSSENVPKTLIREQTLSNGAKVKELGPIVFGYSMIIEPDGKSQIREFGNIKPEFSRGRPHMSIEEKRGT